MTLSKGIARFGLVAVAALLALVPGTAYAQDAGLPDFNDPSALFGFASAVLIIPVIVAHIKPAILPLFRRWWALDPPWELVADVVGIGWAFGLRASGFGPSWLVNWPTCVLAGVVLGVVSGFARDRARDAESKIVTGKQADQSVPVFREPGEGFPGVTLPTRSG